MIYIARTTIFYRGPLERATGQITLPAGYMVEHTRGPRSGRMLVEAETTWHNRPCTVWAWLDASDVREADEPATWHDNIEREPRELAAVDCAPATCQRTLF
jgi:hypothetical protein